MRESILKGCKGEIFTPALIPSVGGGRGPFCASQFGQTKSQGGGLCYRSPTQERLHEFGTLDPLVGVGEDVRIRAFDRHTKRGPSASLK